MTNISNQDSRSSHQSTEGRQGKTGLPPSMPSCQVLVVEGFDELDRTSHLSATQSFVKCGGLKFAVVFLAHCVVVELGGLGVSYVITVFGRLFPHILPQLL